MSPNRDYVTVSMSHATLIADVGAIGRVLSAKGEYSVDQPASRFITVATSSRSRRQAVTILGRSQRSLGLDEQRFVALGRSGAER